MKTSRIIIKLKIHTQEQLHLYIESKPINFSGQEPSWNLGGAKKFKHHNQENPKSILRGCKDQLELEEEENKETITQI